MMAPTSDRPLTHYIEQQRAKARAALPSTRVAASQHSEIYSNAFSSDKSGVEVIESVPQKNRQPPPCLGPRCAICPNDGDIRAFRDVLEIDGPTQTLLAGTGFWFKELKDVLDPAGLVLRGTPEADTITLGGAIATSAHNAGLGMGPCSAYILEMWIKNAADEIVHIKKEDKDFPAAVVSLGLLGAITHVRMQCFAPEKNRLITVTELPTYTGAEFDTIIRDTTSAFRFAPYSKKMVRFDTTETDKPQSTCYGFINDVAAVPCLAYTLDFSIKCLPFLAKITSQVLVVPGEMVADKLNTFSSTPTLKAAIDIEYAVDLADAGACFDALQATVDENTAAGRFVTYQFWVRLLGAVDGSYVLALSAGGDKAVFEFVISANQRGVDEFYASIISVLRKFNGRPHLGKTIKPEDVPYVAQVYGSTGGGAPFRAFEETRQKFDPNGKFLNPTLREFVEKAKVAAGA